MVNKIRIGVSSCLLGEAVRYDGTDKHIPYLTEQLVKEYNLVSLCPEMAIGMGVPRPPIQLVAAKNGIKVLHVDKPDKDMAAALSDYAVNVAKEYSDICGYIFKKNSPSCGTKQVKVLNNQGEYESRGVGVYAAKIIEVLPGIPVIDEEDFLDESLKKRFLLNVVDYSYQKSLQASFCLQ